MLSIRNVDALQVISASILMLLPKLPSALSSDTVTVEVDEIREGERCVDSEAAGDASRLELSSGATSTPSTAEDEREPDPPTPATGAGAESGGYMGLAGWDIWETRGQATP